MNNNNENIRGVKVLGAVIACLSAFINKYPLVYPDTGSYIYSGFNNLVFDDRSIFYGLFLRHISLASSLWYVVFLQGLIVSYLIHLTVGIFYSGIKKDIIFIGTITFLSLTTAFSFTVGILIPDIFSAVSILCLINLFLNNKMKKIEKILVSILFVFSICTQFSSLAILSIFFFVLGIFMLYRKIKSIDLPFPPRNFLFSFTLTLFCFVLIPFTHFAFSKEFKISGSAHVFVMNHFLETGILEDYLEEECEHNKFKICEYKNRLGWDFIWSPESALQKTGGWKANKDEYNFIIRDILTTPKYFILLSQKSLEYTLKQFFTFDVEVSAPQLHASPPYGQINWRFKDSMREYISSKQNGDKWELNQLNFLQRIIVIGSFIFLLTLLLVTSLSSKLGFEIKWTVILIFLYILINSFICSNLSTIDARFQNRIIWLVPLCAIICFFKLVEFKSLFTAKAS